MFTAEMQFFKLYWLWICLGILFCNNANATHIVGGELNYKYLGNGQYKIVLNLYKDCGTSIVPFDDPASIYVFGEENTVIDTLLAPLISRDTLSAAFDDTCLVIPDDVCVDFAQYEIIANLPPNQLGYTLAYIRCCRNSTILNAEGRDEEGEILPPDLIGVTYSAKIPGNSIAAINTNPEFKEFPPIILCSGGDIDVDQSAFDVDGDDLVYKLCTPFVGGSLQRVFGDPTVEMPPFEFIHWVEPYNLDNVLGGEIPLEINPVTGKLTGSAPNMVGQFVVGVCVEEYRNGVLLSTTKRDFQFNIAECVKIFDANFNITDDGFFEEDIIVLPDTTITFTRICDDDLTVQFTSLATGSDSVYWHFGDGSPIENIASPTHTFPDTGKYTVQLIAQPNNVCADTFTQIIDLQYQEVQANFTFDEPQCYHPELGLQFYDASLDAKPIDSWNWNFGNSISSNQQNPIAFYDLNGNFNVSLAVQAQNGCRDTINQSINIAALDSYFLQDSIAFCQQDSIQIPLEIEGQHSFTWSPNIFLSNNSIQQPYTFAENDLTYFVEILTTRPSGVNCTQNDSIAVLTNYPVPELTDLTEPVQCNEMIQLSVALENSDAVLWALDQEFDIVIGNAPNIQFYQSEETKNYYIQFNNRFCKIDTAIAVKQHAININAQSIENCLGDSSYLVIDASSNLNNLVYEWSYNQNSIDTNEPFLTIYTEETSLINVSVQNESGCVADTTISLIINELPDVELEATEESVINQQEIQLSTISEPNYQYNWTPDYLEPISNPTVLVDETTTFYVEVTDEKGCKQLDSITVFVTDIPCKEPDIFIPNAFSPNNDGLNDLFRIQGEVIESLNLQIFDRWGNIVFETDDLSIPWNGDGFMNDVFGYRLSILCFGGEYFTKEGSITLIK